MSGIIRKCEMLRFQSTHPRGVRQDTSASENHLGRVSIHAPAWGATLLAQVAHCQGERVSIHAPAWGATPMDTVSIGYPFVSIHAPAWGATRRPKDRSFRGSCFNPRTRVGCDGNRCAVARPSRCFNPRTRVGCDTCAAVSVGWLAGFNPRTRVGCDSESDFDDDMTVQVSIHAPAWGATSKSWSR